MARSASEDVTASYIDDYLGVAIYSVRYEKTEYNIDVVGYKAR